MLFSSVAKVSTDKTQFVWNVLSIHSNKQSNILLKQSTVFLSCATATFISLEQLYLNFL